MCFSAEADFVSGAVIGAIGVATLVAGRETARDPARRAAAGVRAAPDRRGIRVAGPRRRRGPRHRARRVRRTCSSRGCSCRCSCRSRSCCWSRRAMRGGDSRGSSRSVPSPSAYLAASLLNGDVSAHSGGNVVLYGGGGRYADAATALLHHRDVRCAALLAPPDHRLVRDRQPRRRRGHRGRPGRGTDVDLVLVGRGRQRAHLLPARRVAPRRAHRLRVSSPAPSKGSDLVHRRTDRHAFEGGCQSAETSR